MLEISTDTSIFTVISPSQYHSHVGPDLNIFQNFASRRSLSELIYQNMDSNHFGFFLQQRYCIIFHGKIRNSEQFYLEIIENIFYYFLLCFFVRSTNHLEGAEAPRCPPSPGLVTDCVVEKWSCNRGYIIIIVWLSQKYFKKWLFTLGRCCWRWLQFCF